MKRIYYYKESNNEVFKINTIDQKWIMATGSSNKIINKKITNEKCKQIKRELTH